MYISKLGDIISCDNGVYEVIQQFTYNEEEYVMLKTLSTSFAEVITDTAPIYIAKEDISEDNKEFSLDFLEDKNLVEKIKKHLKIED